MSGNLIDKLGDAGAEVDSTIVDLALVALQARVEAGASRGQVMALESPADRKRRQLSAIFDRMTSEPNGPQTSLPVIDGAPSITELLGQAKAEVEALKRLGEY